MKERRSASAIFVVVLVFTVFITCIFTSCNKEPISQGLVIDWSKYQGGDEYEKASSYTDEALAGTKKNFTFLGMDLELSYKESKKGLHFTYHSYSDEKTGDIYEFFDKTGELSVYSSRTGLALGENDNTSTEELKTKTTRHWRVVFVFFNQHLRNRFSSRPLNP